MLPTLRRLALAVSCLLVTSCAITPGENVALPTVATPLFESIGVEGLLLRDRRVAGYRTTVTSGSGSSSTALRDNFGNTFGSASTELSSTNVHRSTNYEFYDSAALREQLHRLLEDHNFCRRVNSDAALKIVGRVTYAGADTGAGRITWNVINCLGPCLVGLPFLGSTKAAVELRVYRDDEIIAVHNGAGSATWRHPMFGIIPAAPEMRLGAIRVASQLALRQALLSLVEETQRNGNAATPEREQPRVETPIEALSAN